MHAVRAGLACAAIGAVAGAQVAGCSDGDARITATSPVVERLIAGTDATGTDTVAVWMCAVPIDTVDPIYAASTFRLEIDAHDVVERAGARLTRYFHDISHGRYDLAVVAGGTIAMTAAEDSHACAERAIDAQVRSGEHADVVLAIGTAEHHASSSGGWGSAGRSDRCGSDCTLATSRRAAYVGASDFHPEVGDVPLLDLVEHELAHTLGLPHSGDVTADADGHVDGYASALDLMSDSAAPRNVDPLRIDGPDILAVDRLALGWLVLDDVVVIDGDGTDDIDLRPSAGPDGTRLAVAPIDEHRILTVELLTATGYNSHLPAAGVAVHLVDDGPDPATGALRTGTARLQRTLVGDPPFTDLLGPGESWTAEGWTITVTGLDAGGAQLAIRRTDG